jgi:Rieske Fe-S protein
LRFYWENSRRDHAVRTEQQRQVATRRTVLIGAGAVGVGAAAVACGGKTQAPEASTPEASASTTAAAPTSTVAPVEVKTSDVPVAGGVILKDQDTVVTQPQAGDFKAFSATCTHKGCKVGSVGDGTINCPCHGSKYSITDGAVVNGPASKPLPAKTATVNGDTVTVTS